MLNSPWKRRGKEKKAIEASCQLDSKKGQHQARSVLAKISWEFSKKSSSIYNRGVESVKGPKRQAFHIDNRFD